jgi:hypothetical protein
MKWIIDGSEYGDVDEAVSAVIDALDEIQYEEYLDAAYGDVNVCGCEYRASEVLKGVDPTAFRCGYADWTDSVSCEIREQLEEMDDGDDSEILGVRVEVTLTDEEDAADVS